MSRRNHANKMQGSRSPIKEAAVDLDPDQLTQLDVLHELKTKNKQANWTDLAAALLSALPTQSIPDIQTLKTSYAFYIKNSRTIEGISERNPEARVIFHKMISQLIGVKPQRHQLVTITRILSWALFRPHQEHAHFTVHAIRHFIRLKPTRVLVGFSAAQRTFLQKAKRCLDHPEQIERIHEWNTEAVFGAVINSATRQSELSALEPSIAPAWSASPARGFSAAGFGLTTEGGSGCLVFLR